MGKTSRRTMKVKMIGRAGAPNQQLPFTVLKPDRENKQTIKQSMIKYWSAAMRMLVGNTL